MLLTDNYFRPAGVPGQSLAELFRNQQRAVILFAQMGKKQGFKPRPDNLVEQLNGFDIGQVTVFAANPLLQRPGIRAVPEHLLIVIRFDNQHPAAFQLLGHQPRRQTEIGDKTDPTFVRIDDKSDRVNRIVGG